MSKVVVGMSGGVDSAVAALLLQKEGHEVIGVLLRTWESGESEEGNSKCCEIDDARAAALRMGIKFHAFNCIKEFEEKVIEPFKKEYINGRTPNPCIECNRYVKFEKLLQIADILKADKIATGHYARLVSLPDGRFSIKRPADQNKDQTYMLYKLSQEQLKRTIFPLGGLSKDEVRSIARENGLDVAEKKDSQEICFIPDNDHSGFIRREYQKNGTCFNEKTDPFEEGEFVDKNGVFIGKHKGIVHYTVGQRRGLGISAGHHVYVTRIVPEDNRVVIGDEEDLYSTEVEVRDYNFMKCPEPALGESVKGTVKIRYHHLGESAEIIKADDRLIIRFGKPVRAAAPGQSAVFYDDEGIVIGGGVIS